MDLGALEVGADKQFRGKEGDMPRQAVPQEVEVSRRGLDSAHQTCAVLAQGTNLTSCISAEESSEVTVLLRDRE